MSASAELSLTCDDFLKDNHRFYAQKARRKKIALIRIKATNRHSSDVRMLLGETKLVANENPHAVEPPAVVLRKLSEFTWDFLLYLIFAFHPVLAAIDVFFLLTGPLYNRRLKQQLRTLSDGEMLLKPGESAEALVGFRGVSKGAAQRAVTFSYSLHSERHQVHCAI